MRLVQLQADVSDLRVQTSLAGFAAWLKARRGAQYAALNIQRYVPFLDELHSRWADLPNYSELLSHVTAEGLRRVRLVVQWLEETGQIQIDPVARERSSEMRRIAHSLGVFPEGAGQAALHAYHRLLQSRHNDGKMKLRSMRLALSSAVRLQYIADEGGQKLPNQRDLLKLLRTRPGLWASLFGFVSFLNHRYSRGMDPWVDPAWRLKATRALRESKLLQLYAEAGAGEVFERRWISAALSCFHELGRVGVNSFNYRPDNQDAQPGFIVTYQNQEYWVPVASVS
ncbi:hypothetical protein ID144_08640 [Pseudomonas sp. JM0905a]|uniref:hypothetical protein n=1 Tax=Pseudomonas sp. JM0905a TaxID=2772484 RepID=UPI001689789E|nr:hypothetical protein [Pseudomonas sp. JM0905a]MBD2837102.1 hypothetical protein [Pseudomonas sp. JM0905a]